MLRNAIMVVKLVAGNGWVSLGHTDNVSFVEGDGTEDGVILVAGTMDNINTALDGLTFRPKYGYTGPGYLAIVTIDCGNQGTGSGYLIRM